MFIITQQHFVPSQYHVATFGGRRSGKGCHRQQGRHHHVRYHPYPESAEHGCGRRAAFRRWVQSPQQDDDAAAEAVERPSNSSTAENGTDPHQEGSAATTGGGAQLKPAPTPAPPATTESPALATRRPTRLQRYTNTEDSIILERTPAHRDETEDVATIALDVSGFTADQLEVRLELDCVEEGSTTQPRHPILIISGQRVNNLGDRYVIRRRFLLERDNLAEDISTIPIQASMSTDGVLTVLVPKKKKKEEPVDKPMSRSIPISTVPAVGENGTTVPTPIIEGDVSAPPEKEPDVVTVPENDEEDDGAKKPAAK